MKVFTIALTLLTFSVFAEEEDEKVNVADGKVAYKSGRIEVS